MIVQGLGQGLRTMTYVYPCTHTCGGVHVCAWVCVHWVYYVHDALRESCVCTCTYAMWECGCGDMRVVYTCEGICIIHTCMVLHAMYAHSMVMKDDYAPGRILHSANTSPVFMDP